MTPAAAPAQALAEALRRLMPEARALGVAVSGGGDSMALLHLLGPWARERDVALRAASVDHGLRPEAGAEVALAAQSCARLDIPHDILTWEGAVTGNLQAAARDARYGLLADWARDHGLDAVCLGHTQDDQAETVLLRLMRGSGVDGLAAMHARSTRDGTVWLRPLLDVSRASLREVLRGLGAAWAEDPSNTDPRFDRVRARRVMAELDISAERLSATAAAMARAQEALGRRAAEVAETGAVRFDWGDLLLDAAQMRALDDETALRLLAEALRWVSGARYRPRLSALTGLRAALLKGRGTTLHGCLVRPERHAWRVCREYNAVAGLETSAGALWDGRWRLDLAERAAGPKATVKPLGQLGLTQVARPDPGPPQASLRATPALWQGERVLAVPRLKWGLSSRVDRRPEPASFVSGLIPH